MGLYEHHESPHWNSSWPRGKIPLSRGNWTGIRILPGITEWYSTNWALLPWDSSIDTPQNWTLIIQAKLSPPPPPPPGLFLFIVVLVVLLLFSGGQGRGRAWLVTVVVGMRRDSSFNRPKELVKFSFAWFPFFCIATKCLIPHRPYHYTTKATKHTNRKGKNTERKKKKRGKNQAQQEAKPDTDSKKNSPSHLFVTCLHSHFHFPLTLVWPLWPW